MYIVTIKNESYGSDGQYVLVPTEIQNEHHRLASGSVVKGINAIDSFSFSVLPNNPGFNNLHDFKTLVEVYNTTKRRYEFYGRVLCTSPSMSDDGKIALDATCESFFGYLCDSVQEYGEEMTRTVGAILTRMINTHNSQVEDSKKFILGTVEDRNTFITGEIQRSNTWEAIKKNLLDVHGGEIRFRVTEGGIVLDYVKRIGEEKATTIEVSKNMKSIVKEKDPSAFITRLIPLGARLGENTEKRLDISTANGGVNYIDDEQAIKEYGIHVGHVEFDDITSAGALLIAGREWLEANNKVAIKYSITALDLSIIGLDIDDFDVGNYYPVKNKLLGIDDVARVNKKTIDVCDETKTTLEIGESFKTLSEIQREQMNALGKVNADIAVIVRDYTPNKQFRNEITKTVSMIQQSEEDIILSVSGGTVSVDDYNTFKEAATAAFALKVGIDEKDRIVSMINASANIIDIKSNRLSIDSDHFKLTTDGRVTATALKLNSDKFNLTEDGTVSIRGGSIQLQGSTGEVSKGRETIKIDDTGLSVESSGTGIFRGNYTVYGSYHSDCVYYSAAYNDGTGELLGLIYVDPDTYRLNLFGAAGINIGNENSSMTHRLVGNWYIGALNSTTEVRSDRNKKNSIEAQPSVYSQVFDALKPVIYKYNDGESGRYHTGFIAQDVEDAVLSVGLTTKDFAAVCYKRDADGNKVDYGVRYEEIVSLNTYEIQKLKARVKELEERIAKI